ncbi:3-oxoacyl-(acyl carrier protein) synthase III [Pontibacter sp. BAB1700]|nr:3-oxoacyl-(acyl carrier protein) synthase III [Pontibacter sp. BAB1700]
MSKITAAITGVAGYVPDYVLTNKELETMVDTNDEWILSRTGIKERRILKGEGKGTSHIAVPAVLDLLKKTNTKAEEVDLLICATTTPDMVFPATANLITAEVGAVNASGTTCRLLARASFTHWRLLRNSSNRVSTKK